MAPKPHIISKPTLQNFKMSQQKFTVGAPATNGWRLATNYDIRRQTSITTIYHCANTLCMPSAESIPHRNILPCPPKDTPSPGSIPIQCLAGSHGILGVPGLLLGVIRSFRRLRRRIGWRVRAVQAFRIYLEAGRAEGVLPVLPGPPQA